MSVAERMAGKRICVCTGSGGVGKTTTSAAIAIGLAASGQKVAVVTIDPARRLATSLGLDQLGNEPRRVDPAHFAGHGLDLRGELWAMTLDAKRTFDELIELLAPDARARDEILANRIYQPLSTAVAGSQEFTAVAKLYELDASGRFDTIVLDTPPSRSALDFIDAPQRLSGFFEGRALKVLTAPSGALAALAARGSSLVFPALRRVTGVDLLADLGDLSGCWAASRTGSPSGRAPSTGCSPTRRRPSSSSPHPSLPPSRRRSSSGAGSRRRASPSAA